MRSDINWNVSYNAKGRMLKKNRMESSLATRIVQMRNKLHRHTQDMKIWIATNDVLMMVKGQYNIKKDFIMLEDALFRYRQWHNHTNKKK